MATELLPTLTEQLRPDEIPVYNTPFDPFSTMREDTLLHVLGPECHRGVSAITFDGTRQAILVLKDQATLSIWNASDPSNTEEYKKLLVEHGLTQADVRLLRGPRVLRRIHHISDPTKLDRFIADVMMSEAIREQMIKLAQIATKASQSEM